MNVAELMVARARVQPGALVVIEPSGRTGWRTTTFAELDERTDAIAHGLADRGVRPGDRVALFVPPGRELIAIAYALWKLGAIPILVDPGMGRANVVRCLARTRPRVLVGVWKAHALRALSRRELSSIEIAILAGKGWPGSDRIDHLARPSRGAFPARSARQGDDAAILFTSGSTGPPKGVAYTHGHFHAQLDALRALYGFAPGERDLACFPLFALFDAALGTTAVIPRIDPLRPGTCDPAVVARALLDNGCTYGFGSPAIWRRVVPWARAGGVRFETLTRALIAGAPVSPALVRDLRALLSVRGDVHTPYGATECLPVSSICGLELASGISERVEGGHGSCVGRAAPGIEIAIVPVTEGVLERVDTLAPRTIGEICVRGAVVTRDYADDPIATRAAKILDGSSFWHRTGDAGYVDEAGRLWTVGRVAHRVEAPDGTHWPVMLENVCDLHPAVRRSALVGVGPRGRSTPLLVVEPHAGVTRSAPARERLRDELQALLAAKRIPGAPAQVDVPERLLECARFPVDVRHNAKIRREDLARFAEASGA